MSRYYSKQPSSYIHRTPQPVQEEEEPEEGEVFDESESEGEAAELARVEREERELHGDFVVPDDQATDSDYSQEDTDDEYAYMNFLAQEYPACLPLRQRGFLD